MKDRPPLSTQGKPCYRCWNVEEYLEHLQRIKELAEEAIESKAWEDYDTVTPFFDTISDLALRPTY
jgi:hypothetical protein